MGQGHLPPRASTYSPFPHEHDAKARGLFHIPVPPKEVLTAGVGPPGPEDGREVLTCKGVDAVSTPAPAAGWSRMGREGGQGLTASIHVLCAVRHCHHSGEK